MAAKRLVLLGDSILDNGSYAAPKPGTAVHLKQLLGSGWKVSLLAQDGAQMRHVDAQIRALDSRPDFAVLSIGGNDVTQYIDMLEDALSEPEQVLDQLIDIADEFARSYEAVVRSVIASADRTVVCTIYEVQLEPPAAARLVRIPLDMLNDRICRVAARLGIEALDLRTVCTVPQDFVMQIEPSAQGAAKIAATIARLVENPIPLSSARIFVEQ